MTMHRPLVGALLAATAVAGSAAAETRLSFNILYPQTHFAWPVFQAWADDIAEATDGEVIIDFPAQSVAPPPGILDSVRNSVVDGGFIFNGFIRDAAPGTMITQMPFMTQGDSEAASGILWQTYQENFAEVEDLRGVELVSMFHLGPTYLCSISSVPISSLEDLQSRRVWALPGTVADTLAAMDIAITASPGVQLQELASRATVDAHLGLTMETIIAFGVAPYTRSCVDMSPALQSASFSIFFNQRTWDRLPEEHRAAIMELSGEALARRLGAATNEADAAARAKLEAMGVTFEPIDEDLLAAMMRAGEGVAAKWFAAVERAYGIDGAALLEETRTAIAGGSSN